MQGLHSISALILLSLPFKVLAHIFLLPSFHTRRSALLGGYGCSKREYQIWIEASSCSCECVFSFVTSHDHGQSTQHMCEVLCIRCNGPCVKEWCPGGVLCGTQFRTQRRVQRHTVDVEDNTLSCFEACKDFSVPCDVEDFEPTEEMLSFRARPSMAKL